MCSLSPTQKLDYLERWGYKHAVGEIVRTLIDTERPMLTGSWTSPWVGDLGLPKMEAVSSWLLDNGYKIVNSSLMLRPLWLPHWDGLKPGNVSQNRPFLP